MNTRPDPCSRYRNLIVASIAWLWVLGVLAAYIYGFTDIFLLLVRAIFRVDA